MPRNLSSLPWSLVTSAALLTGCAQPTLTQQALAFNETVQEHRLQQLFLNVIRAAHEEPITMTSIGTLGTINKKSVNGSVGFEAGPLSVGPYGVEIGGDVSSQPTMNLLILDNDEKFVTGFNQPVPQEKIAFLVQQGRNPELLAHLLVELIDMPVRDLPESERHAVAATGAGLDAGFVTLRNDPLDPLYPVFHAVLDRRVPGDLVITDDGFGIRDSQARILVRSPERILRFLGVVARGQLESFPAYTVPQVAGKPLFLVRSGLAIGPVTVLHRGVPHAIPAGRTSHSLACLSFLQDLINIQSKQVPAAPATIQLIGN